MRRHVSGTQRNCLASYILPTDYVHQYIKDHKHSCGQAELLMLLRMPLSLVMNMTSDPPTPRMQSSPFAKPAKSTSSSGVVALVTESGDGKCLQ